MAAIELDRGQEVVVGLGAGGEEEAELRLGRAAEARQGSRDPGAGGLKVDRQLEISVGRRGLGGPLGIRGAVAAATGAATAVAAAAVEGGDGKGEVGVGSGSAEFEKEQSSRPPVAVEEENRQRSGEAPGGAHWP